MLIGNIKKSMKLNTKKWSLSLLENSLKILPTYSIKNMISLLNSILTKTTKSISKPNNKNYKKLKNNHFSEAKYNLIRT
jgi:hypothetical protein